jgi:hypothetical protein
MGVYSGTAQNPIDVQETARRFYARPSLKDAFFEGEIALGKPSATLTA